MTNNKNEQNKKTNTKVETKNNANKNKVIMKVLVVLGVLIFFFIIIYLMYHFFVEKSYLKINMSTDKQMEYITLAKGEELIATQKYVSDLEYSMRYDINNFKVFKYKSQDIFKFLQDERVLVVVEKSTLPNNCTEVSVNTEYNNCYVKVDNYTEEYYLSSNSRIYKITVKTPGVNENSSDVNSRINFMLNSFAMTN